MSNFLFGGKRWMGPCLMISAQSSLFGYETDSSILKRGFHIEARKIQNQKLQLLYHIRAVKKLNI